MPALHERQASMASVLFAPEAAAPGGRRFDVHRNNVATGLIGVLEAAYPAVRAFVGARFFQAAAREFSRAHPPRSPVMILWGETFPGWIASFPPAAAVPYLGDVARLERAWTEAYHAEEATPLGRAAVAPPRDQLAETRFDLHPSLRIVESRWPVASLWAEAIGRAPRSRLDLGKAETALIVRPDDRVMVRAVSPARLALIRALADGESLAAAASACEALLDLGSSQLADEIGALFDEGIIIGLRGRTV